MYYGSRCLFLAIPFIGYAKYRFIGRYSIPLSPVCVYHAMFYRKTGMLSFITDTCLRSNNINSQSSVLCYKLVYCLSRNYPAYVRGPAPSSIYPSPQPYMSWIPQLCWCMTTSRSVVIPLASRQKGLNWDRTYRCGGILLGAIVRMAPSPHRRPEILLSKYPFRTSVRSP